MNNEIWKQAFYNGHPVDGLEVSSWGRMRRGGKVSNGTPSLGRNGYLKQMMVCVSDTEYKYGHRAVNLHRIVLETFKGIKWIPGRQVDHIDRNVTNGRVENLRMVTRSENVKNRGILPTQKRCKSPEASAWRIRQCIKYGVFRIYQLPHEVQLEYFRRAASERKMSTSNRPCFAQPK